MVKTSTKNLKQTKTFTGLGYVSDTVFLGGHSVAQLFIFVLCFCLFFAFVLCLVPNAGYVSELSILDCPFNNFL
jgi:hypothetical protein